LSVIMTAKLCLKLGKNSLWFRVIPRVMARTDHDSSVTYVLGLRFSFFFTPVLVECISFIFVTLQML
jgi:hypothetical protein